MEHLPKHTNLVSETASTLKDWINTGLFKEVLPGELQMKKRLGVGRDTLRLALKSLTQEGWVAPALKGQQRHIRVQPLPSGESLKTELLPVTFLSPNPVEARVTLLEMEDTQVHLAEQGRKLRFIAPDIFHLKHPDCHLERLVRGNPSVAWILSLATEPMQRWFDRRGIPALIYGSPFPDVKLPFVGSDWGVAAFHAGIQLVRQGHRVIGIMEYQEQSPGVLAEEQGLHKALAIGHAEGQLVVLKNDRTPASVARALEQSWGLPKRPTALVLTNTSQLLTCYSWLVSQGIRVPADVSLVSLANDSWFADLHPPVCYYQPDSKLMARHIAQRVSELIDAGLTTKKSLRIQLEYVRGGTIGPAPNL
jgi:hypothetical protein